MKNIHILPTDKPSRLFIDENILILDNEYLPNIPSDGQNQHIYITSDEEIKEGDWMIRGNEQPIKVTKDFFWDFGVRYYKIILTTDQDLIKDGVQAIDDEFLEWFVKNPSCEEVEVNLIKDSEDHPEIEGGYREEWQYYEIIIPKEEPKQRLEKYSERFDNKENEIVQGIFNPENWGNRLVNDEPKQETAVEWLCE